MIQEKLFDLIEGELTENVNIGFDKDVLAVELTKKLLPIIAKRPFSAGVVRFTDLTVPLKKDKDGFCSTVISILNDNKPFLLDSLRGLLRENQLKSYLMLHPIFNAQRDAKGQLMNLSLVQPNGQDEPQKEESLIIFCLSEKLSAGDQKIIKAKIETSLRLIDMAVRDWRLMSEKVKEAEHYIQLPQLPISAEDRSELLSFMSWINDNHFTFLGYRSYTLDKKGQPNFEKGLGVLSDTNTNLLKPQGDIIEPDPHAHTRLHLDQILTVTKTTVTSAIHRIVPMDMLRIRKYDAKGHLLGEIQFVGLFTSTAYSRAAREIPLIRLKTHRVLERAGFLPNWHDGKALAHIMETLPRDELFQYSDEDLFRISMGVLQLQQTERTSVFIRFTPFGHYVTALVYIPMNRYSPKLREQIQGKLEAAFSGRVSDWQCEMGSLPFARLYFIINTPNATSEKYNHKKLEKEIALLGLGWLDKFNLACVKHYGREKGQKKYQAYASVFPVTYQDRYRAEKAVEDIEFIEKSITPDSPFSVDLYGAQTTDGYAMHIRVFSLAKAVPLADIFPQMANMGLRVLSEQSCRLKWSGTELWVHDFRVAPLNCDIDQLLAHDALFEDCLKGVWYNHIEDDRFNALVVQASIGWRDVLVLRALSRYLRQIQPLFNPEYVQRTLGDHAGIAKRLVGLFHRRLDPAHHKKLDKPNNGLQVRQLVKDIEADLQQVQSLDEDRILRSLLNLVLAIVRTNYYQPYPDGTYKTYVSFKFDCEKIEDMPLPKPKYEVFVYSPSMEAVHLRGGKVARGGIRWSDRLEDFRTEILGLVKAQMVKNAVIVPTGAKGGFILKKNPATLTREEFLHEGVTAYKTMIHGLLDITDNLVNHKVVHPHNIVIYDQQDPYLVVAADKGTATFSDTANTISAAYKFWLGDAFASGGSAGYDHKKMAITARGAWVSVQRHFRELGVNVDKDDFTVVGVGDMSGDVFGNGMLCSRHIKLVAAFNHLHIFIDPTPDPETSYVERKRLFDLPRSSWRDYNEALLSKGGGIYDRSAKSIVLEDEAAAALGLTTKTLTPDELIRAILKSRTDLLWFGGIGTYVKASDQSNHEVGDKINNNVRVDGKALRCKVVAEGANLGVTQRGRIEFAALGGHVYTDAIDNSGGVDCSDHEVNLKILMQQLMEAKRFSLKKRNEMLTDMKDDVARLVLRDNYQQTQSISIMHSQDAKILDQQERLMKALEREGQLNRALEDLPSDDTLAERHANGIGLHQPELAVLMAYAKITIKESLMATEAIIHEPAYETHLIGYFPPQMRQMFSKEIMNYPLKKELMATILTNEIVNRTGAAFVNDMVERSGAEIEEILKAYTIVTKVFDMHGLWAQIEALDYRVPADIQQEMLLRTVIFLRRAVLWFLRHADRPLNIAQNTALFESAINELEEFLPKLITKNDMQKRQDRASKFIQAGVPRDLAMSVVYLSLLAFGCRIVKIANTTNVPLKFVAAVFYRLSDLLGLYWVLEVGTNLPTNSYWEKLSMGAILDDFTTAQGDLTEYVIHDIKKQKGWQKEKTETLVNAWLDKNKKHFANLGQLFAEFKSAPTVDLAMISVAARHFRRVLRNM